MLARRASALTPPTGAGSPEGRKMTISNPTTLLRQLKGAPLSCLLGLLMAGRQVGATWLAATTGYSEKTVHLALRCLQELQFAVRNERENGWALTERGSQLFQGMEVTVIDDGIRPDPQNLRDDSPTTTAADSGRKDSEEEVVVDEEAQKLRLENLEALHQVGIMARQAEKLSRLAHVTPAFIRAHARLARVERIPRWILMCRIRDGDPVEEELDPADQDEKERRKYISGPLGMYIEH